MSQKKFWKEFRSDIKQGIKFNSDDIVLLKSAVSAMEERDKGLSIKIDNLNDTFDKHDTAEMIQYKSIDLRLRNQARMIWIGFGILLASQYFIQQVPVQG